MRQLPIVIPTRNRPHDLSRCLASIASLDSTDVQVVVADQSDSELAEQVVAQAGIANLVYGRCAPSGKSAALNAGQ